MSMKYENLVALSDEELIKLYDEQARYTVVGLNYFTEEIVRRRNEKTNKALLNYTKWITIMTAVMLLSTIINVVVAIIF
jgi:hypothetical protein